MVTELCVVEGQKESKLWDKTEMANGLNEVRSEEMGLETKQRRCWKSYDRHSKIKLTDVQKLINTDWVGQHSRPTAGQFLLMKPRKVLN
jgi:hypothetical protein